MITNFKKLYQNISEEIKKEIEQTEKRMGKTKEDIFQGKYEDKDIVLPTSETNAMNFIDICAGVGGFHIALKNIKEIKSKCI